MAIIVYGFGCHVELVQAIEELKEPTEERVGKVIKRSVSLNILLFLTFGMAGYFSTYDQTSKIVIDREPL